MGGGEKCKNHKKLHQFCSKISVHLKTDYHITTHYPREKKTGTFTSGSREHNGKGQRNSVVKYYTRNFTMNRGVSPGREAGSEMGFGKDNFLLSPALPSSWLLLVQGGAPRS